MKSIRYLPAILLLAAAPFAQAADPIGRIFYTPEQRVQLDSLRTKRVVASQVRNEPVPEFVTYNGIVRRSDGQATVWVNGEQLSEAGLRNKQSIIGRIGRNGQIMLQTPQATGAAQVQLKVGQSAELLSGRVDELYATRRTATLPKAQAETTNRAADAAQALKPGTQSANAAADSEENRKSAPPQ